MLIDSSAWIEFFRPKGIQEVKRRVGDLLMRHAAAYSEPILFEVLSGCSTPNQRSLVEDTFRMSRHVALERGDWLAAVDVSMKLRKKGRQVAAIDLLLSVIAVRSGLMIVTRDADFEIIRDNALPTLGIERMK